MDITDWISELRFWRAGCCVIGTFQNIYTAIRKRRVKETRDLTDSRLGVHGSCRADNPAFSFDIG